MSGWGTGKNIGKGAGRSSSHSVCLPNIPFEKAGLIGCMQCVLSCSSGTRMPARAPNKVLSELNKHMPFLARMGRKGSRKNCLDT